MILLNDIVIINNTISTTINDDNNR